MNSMVCFLLLSIVLSFKTKEANAMNSTLDKETVIDRSDKVIILQRIDYNLWKFVIPILYVVGTVGNMLTIAEGSRHIYYRFYNQWILLATMTIIPFIILISGNLLIIYKMIKYKNTTQTNVCGNKP